MSILIKGMKMPKDCPQCPLSHWNKLDQLTGCELVRRYVPESEQSYWQSDTRPEWCPLVELPDHGDLIEREYAIASACSGRIRALPTTEGGEDWIRVEEVRQSIKSVPVVIPAERSEE